MDSRQVNTEILFSFRSIRLYDKILDTGKASLIGELLWLLNNMILDEIQKRDHIISLNIFNKILNILETLQLGDYALKNGIWLLNSICKGKPAPSYYIVIIHLYLSSIAQQIFCVKI